MKFRISPAAAAVFLAAGFFTGGLRAASAPAAIPFENDAAFNVTLSNTNPSKVVVDGELITSISGPTGAYDQSTTDDGALILSPLVGQNFTLFIQTDHGSSLSLNVKPQPGNSKTLRFTPMSPPLRKNDDAKAWEEGQTYEKTLVALSRAVVNGQVPDDYLEYLQIRNTSDKDMSGLQTQITNELAAKGYRVSSSPDTAYYWIQANVLKAEKMDLRQSQGFLSSGYEGAAMGAALGAGITAYNSTSAGATLGVGLASGLIGMAADAMVEDVNYTMVTDLQISERSKATVTTDNIAALKQGTSGVKVQTSSEQGNRAKYQTRVVSNANKVNLKFEEAQPVLEAQLAKSIAGIM
ncbi:complement resistance protein TraT [Enterobacter soli]|nr:complement resistance protein TraT [Enterobacter soli]MDD9247096.1 complement resistance protein TraT [Enterobacter soli]